MSPEDFDYISQIVRSRSGLVLTKDKGYLLESRLMPIARDSGLKDIAELAQALRASQNNDLIQEIVEAMTTNESFFFRDMTPFDIFRDKVMPDVLKTRASKRTLRVWCAAASSGQEPYSLAILLREMADKMPGWRTEIVGTDISRDILDKAKKGLYTQFEVQRGLPIQLLMKYFDKKDETWQAKEELRAMVQYKEYNLLDRLSGLGAFDVVFCRNVLIYFDQETKTRVLDGIADLMPDDGVLFLGGAETVLGVSDRFKPVAGQRGVYCLNHADPSAVMPLGARSL